MEDIPGYQKTLETVLSGTIRSQNMQKEEMIFVMAMKRVSNCGTQKFTH